MKAVIYSRVSKTTQSTSRQISELKSVNKFQVVKIFKESISGFTKHISERPVLQNAIRYMLDNSIEVLMVHEVSRLGRRTEEILTLIRELKESGLKVYVKTLDILLNSSGHKEPVNQLIITLMADLARMESEQMSLRIKSGLEQRRKNGFHVGRKLGSKEDKDSFLNKPDSKKIIKYLKRGESIRWIANQVNVSPTTVQKTKNSVFQHSKTVVS